MGVGALVGGASGLFKGAAEKKRIKAAQEAEATQQAEEEAALATERRNRRQNVATMEFAKGGSLVKVRQMKTPKVTYKASAKHGSSKGERSLARYRRKYMTPKGMDIYAEGGELENTQDIMKYAQGGGLSRSRLWLQKKPYPSVKSGDFAGG